MQPADMYPLSAGSQSLTFIGQGLTWHVVMSTQECLPPTSQSHPFAYAHSRVALPVTSINLSTVTQAPAMETPLGIVLQRMPQQLLAQTPAEDWTGVTSTAERRKRQNRLNKRSQCQFLSYII
jgi:hypothetical protein